MIGGNVEEWMVVVRVKYGESWRVLMEGFLG